MIPRNEDDMYGMSPPHQLLQHNGAMHGRSPTQFYDPAEMMAASEANTNIGSRAQALLDELPVPRSLLPEFHAVGPEPGPKPKVHRSNAAWFDPAGLLDEMAEERKGLADSHGFARKDQMDLKAAKSRKAQEKAMAKAKNGRAKDDQAKDHGMEENEGLDWEQELAADIAQTKGKKRKQAVQPKVAAAKAASKPAEGRGRARGRGRGRGRKPCASEEVITPEPNNKALQDESPLDGEPVEKKPARKRVAKETMDGTGAKKDKVVKGLPLELRNECKQWPTCIHGLIHAFRLACAAMSG